MRIPRKIDIFGQRITIKICPVMEDDGEFCPTTWMIKIKKSLPPDERLHTLIHEIGHAVVMRTGLKQSELSHDVEEVLVENIATSIMENFEVHFRWSKSYKKVK